MTPFAYCHRTVLILVVTTLTACTITRVSDYDATTDELVSTLHKKTSGFFHTIPTKGEAECGYASHQAFYDGLRVEIDALALRNLARANNSLTIAQIQGLQQSIGAIEQLHQLGCFSEAQIADLKNSLDIHYGAILKLEIAKQRESD